MRATIRRRPGIILGPLLLSLMVTVVAAQAASRETNARQLKVAWVYYGPIDDGGWNQANAAGEKAVGKALGSSVQQAHSAEVSYDAKASQIVQQYATSGYNVLIDPTSFGSLFTNVCKKNRA